MPTRAPFCLQEQPVGLQVDLLDAGHYVDVVSVSRSKCNTSVVEKIIHHGVDQRYCGLVCWIIQNTPFNHQRKNAARHFRTAFCNQNHSNPSQKPRSESQNIGFYHDQQKQRFPPNRHKNAAVWLCTSQNSGVQTLPNRSKVQRLKQQYFCAKLSTISSAAWVIVSTEALTVVVPRPNIRQFFIKHAERRKLVKGRVPPPRF